MKSLFFLVFVCASYPLIAQEDVVVSAYEKNAYDSVRSRYIQTFPHHFFLWPVLKQRRLDFVMEDLPDRRKSLTYKSNKPNAIGLGMYVFELGIEVTFATPIDQKRKEIYGESNTSDLQVNILNKKWGLDLYYQKYQGFYIQDSDIDVPVNVPYPQRPDIATKNIGLTGNYVFNNKKFSFRSAYNFVERQLHSAGSFLLFGTINGFKVRGDSAILGTLYRNDFGTDAKIREIRSTTLSVAPGYTYSLIHKGFFINATLALGPAHNWLSYKTEDGGTKDDIEFTAFVIGRVGLGYNGDHFFGGMSYVNRRTQAKFDTVQLSSSTGTFKILFGYRFREIGFLRRRAEDLPKALGFGG